MGNGRAIVKVILRGFTPANPTTAQCTQAHQHHHQFYSLLYDTQYLRSIDSPLSSESILMFVKQVIVEISLNISPYFASNERSEARKKHLRCTGLRPIPHQKGTRSRGGIQVVPLKSKALLGIRLQRKEPPGKHVRQPDLAQQDCDCPRGKRHTLPTRRLAKQPAPGRFCPSYGGL